MRLTANTFFCTQRSRFSEPQTLRLRTLVTGCLVMICSVPWLTSPAYGQEVGKRPDVQAEDLPAGNEEVARIMREFEGRGDLGDDSPPLDPSASLAAFELPEDLQIELIASEPEIAQPLHISFDARGRMWIVEYRQYPFPAGLKVVRYDQHLRAVFDRVPEPPPGHTRGADRITVLEDGDGDGTYETRRTVIDGLNIATSVAVGGGRIWVMNPPYLLAYPDQDGDAVPDDEPEVHLSGFGLEDTHSVANSIRLGPDGWLYGVNGSTTTARVVALLGHQDPVAFEGQCVWRYHPDTHRFEIYAEGGGNPFGLEMDQGGQVFSGTNWGNTRGMHYPQGGYGVKNWGKHGPLTNPFALGYFNHMPFEGDGRRFTEEFVIYDDAQLPERYHGQLLAVNPLQRIAIASRLDRVGSTYKTRDFESLITTTDRWFRPVDITLGPDGALYVADWYDTRLTHVDPRDTWHKSSGRIYRVSSRAARTDEVWRELLPSRTRFDLTRRATQELLRLLDHPSRWIRMATVRVLSERQEAGLSDELAEVALNDGDPRQLEALWCVTRQLGTGWLIGAPGRFGRLVSSADPDVRRWTLRLLGDHQLALSDEVGAVLLATAQDERDAQVRSQLASTAKRLEAGWGLRVALEMGQIDLDIDREDPHLPLLIWWAVESHADAASEDLGRAFREQPALWESRLIAETVVPRLAQRSVMVGTDASMELAEQLVLGAPPEGGGRAAVFRGLDAGLAASGTRELPEALRLALEQFGSASPHAALLLRLRQGESGAIDQATSRLGDGNYGVQPRVELLEALGELRPQRALDAILGRLGDSAVPVRRAALTAASRYGDAKVAARITSAYQSSMDSSTGLRPQAVRVLASRPEWARRLIAEIDALRIPAELVTPDMVVQMRTHGDEELNADLTRLWGNVRPTAAEKQAEIERLRRLAKAPGGDPVLGRQVFTQQCGKCHRLFGEGGDVGPDLTGYERTNLDFLALAMADPSAAIREEYQTYQALTVDGQLLSGLLLERNDQQVVLRTAEGETQRVARDDLERLQASEVSLMPENLLKPLSDTELQSLLRYISQKRPVLPAIGLGDGAAAGQARDDVSSGNTAGER